jgi:8-amino-7-oxononanoate synthase
VAYPKTQWLRYNRFMHLSSKLSHLWVKRLAQRDLTNQRRHLREPVSIDFCSNDYLGWARRVDKSATNFHESHHGATGSRLLSGQRNTINTLESRIADFHDAPAALIFNSGFDANIGTLAAISDRHTVFLYDELCHASLIDGMRLSLSRHVYKFRHNDVAHLANLLAMHADKAIAVVVESVYSMDGNVAPLREIVQLTKQHSACLIVDEAHGTGVIGARGEGLVQHLGLQHEIDVRIHTYGKAMGCHGAAVLGSRDLIDVLINFSRPFIYSTALPPASYAAISHAYDLLRDDVTSRERLHAVIDSFRSRISERGRSAFGTSWLDSTTPIQGLIVGNVTRARQIAEYLQSHELDVRPILSPTVAKGTERLRICLHAFNTNDELDLLFHTLHKALQTT